MKNITRLSLLTALLLTLSCCPGFSQEGTPSAQSQVPLIAILPGKIVDWGMAKSAIPTGELQRQEHSIAYSLQQEVFQDLYDYIDRYHRQEVALQQLFETNARLQMDQISLQDSWEMSNAELAAILDVDLVLRVNVRYDRGFVGLMSGTSDNPGAPTCDDGITPIPNEVRYGASLSDGITGASLAHYNNVFSGKRGRKHDVVARGIVRHLGPNLPSLLHHYAQGDAD